MIARSVSSSVLYSKRNFVALHRSIKENSTLKRVIAFTIGLSCLVRLKKTKVLRGFTMIHQNLCFIEIVL